MFGVDEQHVAAHELWCRFRANALQESRDFGQFFVNLDIINDCLFATDMLANCNTAVVDESSRDGALIFDHRIIMDRYLKSWFVQLVGAPLVDLVTGAQSLRDLRQLSTGSSLIFVVRSISSG